MDGAHQKRGKTRPFGKTDTAVMRDKTLPLQVKAVYAYLTTYCASKREAWPSRKRIAEEVGCDVRTVDAALRVAVDVGLVDIVHEYVSTSGERVRGSHDEKRPGEQTSNRYVLHDDTYVPGKGPGKKLTYRSVDAGQGQVGVVRDHPDGEVADRPPSGDSPHEVDNRSIPAPRGAVSIETMTPPGEDDCASSTPKQVSGRQLMLKQPKGYATMDRPAAAHGLTSVFIAAVTHVGLKPSHGAENSIGKWVNTVAARGITHDELWRQFVNVTEKAVSGERCAWLIDDGAPF